MQGRTDQAAGVGRHHASLSEREIADFIHDEVEPTPNLTVGERGFVEQSPVPRKNGIQVRDPPQIAAVPD